MVGIWIRKNSRIKILQMLNKFDQKMIEKYEINTGSFDGYRLGCLCLLGAEVPFCTFCSKILKYI